MWSWWGPVQEKQQQQQQRQQEQSQTSRRTVKTKQVHVEIIGGSVTYSAKWDSKQPSTSKVLKSAILTGPPRLPTELSSYIIIFAAQCIIDDVNIENSTILQLAQVDRAAHHAIYTNFVLPKVRLCGIQQVNAFSRDLQRNVLNLQNQVKRVKRLTIWRARERATLEFIKASSLFSGAEEIAYFEKASLESLRVILSYCSNVEHLSLDMPARVLDERNIISTDKSQGHLGKSLKELVTLLSVYGGDLNEALWSTTSIYRPKWNNLTHLQLHGPRFRMTSLTALAISQLPSLTHLALIMPLLVQSQITSSGPFNAVEAQVDSSRDALGRCNVLQILIDALGNRLQTLLLICHDIENYVGNVQRLGPWMRTLQWKCSSKRMQDDTVKQGTKLILVTAKPYNPLQTTPHVSLYSKWMLQRAERGEHWKWTQNTKGTDVCEEMKLSYSVEKWTIPVVFEEVEIRTREDGSNILTGDWPEEADTDAQIGEQDDSPWSESDEETHGIDNLD